MDVGNVELDDDFLFVAEEKTFFGDGEAIGKFFAGDDIFIFGKVIFEGHEVRGLLKPEGEFFGYEEEIIVTDFTLFGLFLEGGEEMGFDLGVFFILRMREILQWGR